MSAAPETLETFHWTEALARLDELAQDGPWERDGDRGAYVQDDLRVRPPLVLPVPVEARTLEEYLESCLEEPGAETVILLQAGAASIARFDRGEPLVTKSIKKYVVRGTGRAQPTHLESKGKSRYGSRLRLQNAKRLLEETNERLLDWEEEFGPADQVLYNAPVRLWPDLFEARPAPPFDREGPLVRIPLDLPRPTTDVLLRAYRSCEYGRLERVEPA